MAAYYGEAATYKAGLLAASKDMAFFEEGERNAILGAYYALVCQGSRIHASQKRVGNHKANARIEQQNYTVYFGWEKAGCVYVEVQHCPDNWTNSYYLSGDRPVRILQEPGNHSTAWVYNWKTGIFEENNEYVFKIFYSTSDVEAIDEESFIAEVGALRKKLCEMEAGAGKVRSWQGAFASFEAACRKRTPGYPESPRVMEALNRVRAIRWDTPKKLRKSHELLWQETCRRLALYIRKRKRKMNEGLFNAAESLQPGDPISEQINALLQESISNEENRNICLWFIHWEQAAEQKDSEALPMENPYEPLIYLFERGGSLELLSEKGQRNLFDGFTLNEIEKIPEIVRLDFETLNWLDER